MALADVLQVLEERLASANQRMELAKRIYNEARHRQGKGPRGSISKKVAYDNMLMAEAAWQELRDALGAARRAALR